MGSVLFERRLRADHVLSRRVVDGTTPGLGGPGHSSGPRFVQSLLEFEHVRPEQRVLPWLTPSSCGWPVFLFVGSLCSPLSLARMGDVCVTMWSDRGFTRKRALAGSFGTWFLLRQKWAAGFLLSTCTVAVLLVSAARGFTSLFGS